VFVSILNLGVSPPHSLFSRSLIYMVQEFFYRVFAINSSTTVARLSEISITCSNYSIRVGYSFLILFIASFVWFNIDSSLDFSYYSFVSGFSFYNNNATVLLRWMEWSFGYICLIVGLFWRFLGDSISDDSSTMSFWGNLFFVRSLLWTSRSSPMVIT
jgi:hypothetical protein